MNYRHAFHAGNHADVLKHVVLVALLDALKRKDTPFFVLDTHAGRGRYDLGGEAATATGEARGGIFALLAQLFGAQGQPAAPEPIAHYLDAVRALNPEGALRHYPGSPLLVAQALRADDRLACCELQPEELAALKILFAADPRVGVHPRDGYGALKALLPPKEKRGLVLIDPPYEAQDDEFRTIERALTEALTRWPQGVYALWYPIKQRRVVQPFLRRAAALPAKSSLVAELLVRPDDSPLRMNGSGMLLLNPPWKLDEALAAALPVLHAALGEGGADWRLDWLKKESA